MIAIGMSPAGGGGGGSVPSVTVTVSDTTPTQNETVTITATPSGVTPSNYLFFYFDGSSIQFLAEQASNIFSWNITNFGTVDVFVVADNLYSNLQEVVIAQAFDPDATAWLNANSFANDATVYNSTYGITGANLWAFLETFYTSLKTESGLYAKVHWAYLYFGSDANKAKLNLVNPDDTDAAYRVTWNGGWLFNDEGRVSNGTNTYGDTHFNASTQLANNDGFYGIYKRTTPSGLSNNSEWGAQDVNVNSFVSKATANRSFYSLGVTVQVSGLATSLLDGFQSINRNNDANLQEWRGNDYSLINSDTTAWVGNPNINEYTGARNSSGTPTLFLENNAEVAFEIRADGLTSSQWLALKNAVDTLMTSLGWNV